jgi:hypothetical protein
MGQRRIQMRVLDVLQNMKTFVLNLISLKLFRKRALTEVDKHYYRNFHKRQIDEISTTFD